MNITYRYFPLNETFCKRSIIPRARRRTTRYGSACLLVKLIAVNFGDLIFDVLLGKLAYFVEPQCSFNLSGPVF